MTFVNHELLEFESIRIHFLMLVFSICSCFFKIYYLCYPILIYLCVFSGGLSNLLYLCCLSEKIELLNGEPRKVLLRLYGQIIRENPDTVLTDSVIFALLSEKQLGPKLYGVFTHGRIEEYVPVRLHFSFMDPCKILQSLKTISALKKRHHSTRVHIALLPEVVL